MSSQYAERLKKSADLKSRILRLSQKKREDGSRVHNNQQIATRVKCSAAYVGQVIARQEKQA